MTAEVEIPTLFPAHSRKEYLAREAYPGRLVTSPGKILTSYRLGLYSTNSSGNCCFNAAIFGRSQTWI